MLGLLVGVPVMETAIGRSTVLVALAGHSVLLFAGVWTLAGSRTLFGVGMVLALASIGTTALASANPTSSVSIASVAIAWTFCLLTATLCIRSVFTRERVTANHLVGATCVYLLLGALWGLAYAALHLLRIDSFRTSDASPIRLADLMYFSFITLTTTGYGDIVPVGRLVRTLASLEGVAGQLYVAILVATLVSQYVTPVGEKPSR